MNKKSIWIIVLIIAVVVLLSLLLKNGSDSQVVKIGYFGPFTGLLSQSTGESVGEGFKLAESERTVVGKKKVQVIYEDDACDPKKAVSAAQKLIEVDGVKILVSGVCSSSTLAVAPIAEKNRIILISPTSASPKISAAGDYIFRLSSPTTGMAQAAVDYLARQNITKVALMFENNEYPAGWKDSFLEAFKGEVVVEGVTPGSTDVKSQLLKLSQAKPQAYVFTVISPPTANAILKQFRELGLKGMIIGNDTFSLKVVHKTPDALGIAAVTYDYDLSSPIMKNLLQNYQKKYAREAKEEFYAALGYDTYNALFDSIELCDGDDTDCIKNELYKRSGIHGVSGTYTIDENGDTKRQFMIRKVENGTLVSVQ